MRRRIDEKAEQVLGRVNPESWSEGMRLYRDWLDGKKVPSYAEIAFDLHDTSAHKERVDALILGGCPDEDFKDALDVPEESIKLYRELFFDDSAFATYLDRIYFAENYYGAGVKPEDNKVLRGLNQGYQVLLLQFCNMLPTRKDAIRILKRVFAAAVYKATSIQYTGTGGMVDRRAMEHCQLAMRIIDSMEAMEAQAPSDDSTGSPMMKFVTVLQESGADLDDVRKALID